MPSGTQHVTRKRVNLGASLFATRFHVKPIVRNKIARGRGNESIAK